MKIIRTLKVTEDEFYDALEEQILGILNHKENATKKYTVADIKKGTKAVQKPTNDTIRTEFEIKEYTRGHRYINVVKTIDDTATSTYTTKVTDKGLYIEYTQHLKNFESRKMMTIARKWSEMLYLSRMTNALYDFQTKIIRKRNNETYDPNPMQTAVKGIGGALKRKINQKTIDAVVKHEEKKAAKKK